MKLLLPLSVFVMANAAVRRESRGGFRSKWLRPLAFTGLISYSLYLIHQPIITAIIALCPFGDTPAQVALAYALITPICLTAASLFFLAFERPAIRLAHRLASKGKPGERRPRSEAP